MDEDDRSRSEDSKFYEGKRYNIYENRYKDTTKRFQGFFQLMFMWKASVLKLVGHDLILFLCLYFLLSILYRCVFLHDPVMREYFEVICVYASRFRTMIPITFLTGFYVTQVVTRYWDQFMALPFPDRIALKLTTYIPGKDEATKNLRITIMRYVNLSTILVFRLISQKVMSRLPDYRSLIRYKILSEREVARLQKIEEQSPHEATWAPIAWALQLLAKARKEGRILLEPPVYANLVSSFEYLEASNRKILNYGWVNFPLAYTQVATLAVYSYMFVSLFAGQYLKPQEPEVDDVTFPHINISFSVKLPFLLHTPDLYIPVFTILEFVGYMGWIKVAEGLLNPFGDDDDDFQINYLIDRNISVSYLIAAGDDLDLSDDPPLDGAATPKLPLSKESLLMTRGEDEPDGGRGVAAKVIRKVSNILGPRPARMQSWQSHSRDNDVDSIDSLSVNNDANSNLDVVKEDLEVGGRKLPDYSENSQNNTNTKL